MDPDEEGGWRSGATEGNPQVEADKAENENPDDSDAEILHAAPQPEPYGDGDSEADASDPDELAAATQRPPADS